MQMPSAQQNWKGGVTCERAVIISKEYEENIPGKRLLKKETVPG